MRIIYLAFLSLLVPCILFANEGTCPRCEVIRKYHDDHPEENYYWYDDYVKEKGKAEDYQPKESDTPKKKATK